MTDDELQRRKTLIEGLRETADFLEANPTVPAPYTAYLNSFVSTRDIIAETARASSWEKVFTDSWFSLKKSFGFMPDDTDRKYPTVTFEVNCRRETVCHKVVTGTRVVPATEERIEETFKWECVDVSLLAVK